MRYVVLVLAVLTFSGAACNKSGGGHSTFLPVAEADSPGLLARVLALESKVSQQDQALAAIPDLLQSNLDLKNRLDSQAGQIGVLETEATDVRVALIGDGLPDGFPGLVWFILGDGLPDGFGGLWDLIMGTDTFDGIALGLLKVNDRIRIIEAKLGL